VEKYLVFTYRCLVGAQSKEGETVINFNAKEKKLNAKLSSERQ
jgi:hypothetical protein